MMYQHLLKIGINERPLFWLEYSLYNIAKGTSMSGFSPASQAKGLIVVKI